MNNLKKMLALSLAATTLFSTAASASFPDQGDIANTEAVDTLVALGVIEGTGDGTFAPLATVDRASMAKMIFVIKLGTEANPNDWKDLDTELSDIEGHWAEGYIKYCEYSGIILGRGEGKFDPNAEVTAVEAFKMALVALGYDSSIEDPNTVLNDGSTWLNNTLALAFSNGISSSLTDSSSYKDESLSRQNAAQVLYNTLFAQTVTANTAGTAYLTGTELATQSLKLVTVSGTVDSSTESDGNSFTFTESASVTIDGSTTSYVAGNTVTFDSSELDLTDYLGQDVNILFREPVTSLQDRTLYGVKPLSTTSSIRAQFSDITFNSTYTTATYDGVTIDISSGLVPSSTLPNTEVYIYRNDTTAAVVELTPVCVGEVTYVTDSKLIVTNSPDSNGALNITPSSHDVEAGLTAGDLVSVSVNAYTSEYEVVALEAVSDVQVTKQWPTSTTGTGSYNGMDSYVIGGVTYYLNSGVTVVVGENYNLEVVGSVVYSATLVDESTALNLAAVIDIDTESTAGEYGSDDPYYINMQLLKADGEVEIVKVSTYNGQAVASGTTTGTLSGLYNVSSSVAHVLVDYKTNATTGYTSLNFLDTANGQSFIEDYTVTDLDTGSNAYTTTTGTLNATTSSYVLNDDAVVYVRNASTSPVSFSVLTGAQVKSWGTEYTNEITNGTVYHTVQTSGLDRVEYAVLNMTSIPGSTSDLAYAYVTGARYNVVEDGVLVAKCDVWNGTSTVTLTVNIDTTVAGYAIPDALFAGNRVQYTVDGNGYANVVSLASTAVTHATTSPVSITAVSTSEGIMTFSNVATEYNITDETVFIYVDVDSTTGLAASSSYLDVSKTYDADPDAEFFAYYTTAGLDLEVVYVAIGTPFATNPEYIVINDVTVTNTGNTAYAVSNGAISAYVNNYDATTGLVSGTTKVSYLGDSVVVRVDLDSKVTTCTVTAYEADGTSSISSSSTVLGNATTGKYVEFTITGSDVKVLEVNAN